LIEVDLICRIHVLIEAEATAASKEKCNTKGLARMVQRKCCQYARLVRK
jgi:hypothetical protein